MRPTPPEVRPLEVAPAVGTWVWTIADRPRNSSFHEVVAIAMVPTDDGPVVLIESDCGRAWPVELLAAAVEASHPVLDRRQDGTSAACSNCTRGGRAGGRRSQWDLLLAAHRAGKEL